MTFDKPKDQWDELDKEDREYMDLVRKINSALANDPNKLVMYLKTDKEVFDKLYQTLFRNLDYGRNESKSE